jgi:formamidopyrimidine-DNA glycosylase
MPELPDLVHVEEVLNGALAGKTITDARTGDPTVLRLMVRDPFPAVLVGRHLKGVARRGHFLRFDLGADLAIVINAMLVGRYKLLPPLPTAERKKDPSALGLALTFDQTGTLGGFLEPPATTALGKAQLRQREGALELQYLDEKRMGKVYVTRPEDEGSIPVYGQLGVELLSPAFTREAFDKIFAKRRDQVRPFLMDKRALASIGNAYADEILFAAGIHPKTFCRKLEPAAVDALYGAIGRVLSEAIAEIRRRNEPPEVKVRDFLKVRGRDGKPCYVCGTTIRAVRVGDGDACFCPTCQPETRKLFVSWSGLNQRKA